MDYLARPSMEALRLVFLHLPRTGGTTLHEALLAPGFRPEECCPERFGNLDRIDPADLAGFRLFSGHYRFDHLALIPHPRFLITVLREPKSRILSLYHFWRRHRPEVVAKHRLEGPRIARSRSLLEFLHSEEPVITEVIDNAMACHLMGQAWPSRHGGFVTRRAAKKEPIEPSAIADAACRALLQFDCVGFTETLGAVHARVASRFGWPSPILPHLNSHARVDAVVEPMAQEPVTPEITRRLLQLTELDAQVLAFAQKDPRVRRA